MHAFTAFARTKIQPPRLRATLIRRGALEEALGRAMATQRLVLLCAPAGFGKTAALTRQIATLEPGTAVAWVAADEDDDITRLAACLVAALDPFDLPWRTSPEALVAAQDGSRAARQALLGELLNALDATEIPRGLIVIDDAHRIEDPQVFELLDPLIERLPPRWGVVIATRVEPPLSLPRLRARDELAEFRQDALRFTRDEVGDLVAQRAPAFGAAPAFPNDTPATPSGSAHIADMLMQRTQGWAAGLGLALSAASANPAANDRLEVRDRHMFDYLATEVLDQLPDDLRLFLLRCAVLPELTASACAKVSGDARAARWLEEIERRGLFVSVRADTESAEPALFLHDLFRDCLDDRLRRELPHELPELLQRAALQERDPVRRMGYWLRAGAWDEAQALMEEVAPLLLTAGAIGTVHRLIEQFPPGLRDEAPRLQLMRGVAGWAAWDWRTMREGVRHAAQGFERAGDHANALRARSYEVLALSGLGQYEASDRLLDTLLAEPLEEATLCRALVAASWHAMERGELDKLAPLWQQMLDALSHSDELARWYECSPLPMFLGMPGMRKPLQRYAALAASRLPEGATTLRGIVRILQANLALWAGDIATAEPLLASALDDCRWLGRPAILRTQSNIALALMHAIRGNAEAADVAAAAPVADLDADPRNPRHAVQIVHFVFFAFRIAIAAGDAPRARQWAERLAQTHAPLEPPVMALQRLTLPAHLAMLEGRVAQACAHWEAALERETAIDVFGQAAETRLRLAAALCSLHRTDEAAAAIAPVFDRVRTSGELGGVLMAGPDVAARLATHAWGAALGASEIQTLGEWSRRVGRLRGASATDAAAAPLLADRPAPPPRGSPVASLSTREAEVLARIAAGDSNKLIARVLGLSPHTVKRHVANILDKLALQSRGQAAAWYRDHARR